MAGLSCKVQPGQTFPTSAMFALCVAASTPSQISTAACVALERASLMLSLLSLECPSGNQGFNSVY